MPEDRGILAAIGRLLQRDTSRGKKKKEQGLKSVLREEGTLSKKDRLLLDTYLQVGAIEGRTDEGALMGLRDSPIGRQIGI